MVIPGLPIVPVRLKTSKSSVSDLIFNVPLISLPCLTPSFTLRPKSFTLVVNENTNENVENATDTGYDVNLPLNGILPREYAFPLPVPNPGFPP